MQAEMNIKTFGPVDQRSLEQLERCMQAGDAEYGVLCADHHPGYSQPIGGAVAYEGYVSPSGVGYDIGCIAAGARVLTRNGYHRAIEDLAPMDHVVKPDTHGGVGTAADYAGILAKGEREVLKITVGDRSV